MPSQTLGGLTGLYGPEVVDSSDYMDEGVLEARAAPGTATSHSSYGSQSPGYGGTVPTDPQTDPQQAVYDASIGTLGQYWDDGYFSYSPEIDQTPTTHDAPWPAGIPQVGIASASTPGGLEIAGEQMEMLHGTNQGGVNALVLHDPTGRENPSHYTTNDYIAPNENILAQIPEQLKSVGPGAFGPGQGGGGHAGGNAGGSSADVDQGYGVNNSMPEFNAGHSIRRIQHDHMPWDYTLLHGEQEVPFYGRHALVGQMDFDGPDSPYFDSGALGGAGIAVPWEGHIGNPTQYVQPPEVTVDPPITNDSSYDIYAWG
jgi:hypothetical protein